MLEFAEIGICLAVIYAFGGLACSVLQELIAQVLGLRARNFELAIRGMLDGDDPVGNAAVAQAAEKTGVPSTNYQRFLLHPLIDGLWDKNRRTTGIPGEVFAKAVIHTFEPKDEAPITDLAELLKTIPPSLQRQIVPFMDAAVGGVAGLEKAARAWFDASMKSAEDWYSARAHWISIAVACLFAFALNIDSVHIAQVLDRDSSKRETLASYGTWYAQQRAQGKVEPCPVDAGKPAAADAAGEKDKASKAGMKDTSGQRDVSSPADAAESGSPASSASAAAPSPSPSPASTAPDSSAASSAAAGSSAADAAAAGSGNPQPAQPDPGKTFYACVGTIDSVSGDLVGWQNYTLPPGHWAWFGALIGWLASGLAMSLGSRFWFETLSSLVSMRAGLPQDGQSDPKAKS